MIGRKCNLKYLNGLVQHLSKHHKYVFQIFIINENNSALDGLGLIFNPLLNNNRSLLIYL